MEAMSSRAERAAALDRWADQVEPETLRRAEPEALRVISILADERNRTDRDLVEAVARARQLGLSWSQIGAELGVSKQAAQRKYGTKSPETSLGGMGF